ncbi:MAG: hypothetical protein E7549_01985 [Ruminococcaceae bacterium]|nr:hypothetical protein [Oscillospiraceae bacterium]
MADYTYATSSGKTYDEWIKETQARAVKQAGAYAERANAANESYKAGINAMYDSRIKAREAAAAADAEKTHASYNAQFDANAASALAGERRLQEQMANYGLTESGYNATNRTALAVARSNADAKTRTARGQAVDAIAADLREYKAGAEEARAKALIEGDRATAERITDAEQTLLQNAHDEAMDMLERDDALRKDEQDRKYQSERDAVRDEQWAKEQALKQQELDHKVAKDAQYADRMVKEYVDEHNGEVYRLMLEAYKSGNAALAEAYAKTLWQVDENGVVSPMPLDTSAATKYTEQQNAFEKEMLLDKAAGNAETAANDEPKTGYDEFGFPRKFSDFITEARSTMHTVSQTGYVYTREQLTKRALNLLYLIRQKTKDKGSEGYMDEATFVNLLQYVGVTAEQYREYEYEINVFLNNSDKKPIRVSPSGATTVYNR